MQIAVAGPRGGSVPWDLHQTITLAAAHYARQLGIGSLHTTILIRAHHKSTLDGVCEGLCEPVDTRHYKIDVCLYANWLQILAHEMVHIKQFARKELAVNMERWKKRLYCGNIDYWNQPWEREAYRLQGRLVEDYAKNPGNPTLLYPKVAKNTGK